MHLSELLGNYDIASVLVFACPECGSEFWGTSNCRKDQREWIGRCYDQYGIGCKFKWPRSDDVKYFRNSSLTPGPAVARRCEVSKLISDEEIDRVHASASFAKMTKRSVVDFGLLKCASGYYQGSTSRSILREHGLITSKYKLTTKGKKYLWEAFGKDSI